MISHDELTRILCYDPETGVMKWKISSGSATPGKVAGSNHISTGYVQIRINGMNYLMHRLIMFYVNAKWPEEVDHINGIRNDNRIENLRSVSRSENMKNSKVHTDSKSGIAGVRVNKRVKADTFSAFINIKGKYVSKTFKDLDSAIEWRDCMYREFNFHENHGRNV